jgi:hypothetical protein
LHGVGPTYARMTILKVIAEDFKHMSSPFHRSNLVTKVQPATLTWAPQISSKMGTKRVKMASCRKACVKVFSINWPKMWSLLWAPFDTMPFEPYWFIMKRTMFQSRLLCSGYSFTSYKLLCFILLTFKFLVNYQRKKLSIQGKTLHLLLLIMDSWDILDNVINWKSTKSRD